MNSVVIWGYTNFKWLWVPLAKELKRQHGTTIHFLCTDAQSIAFWKKQDPEGVIDSFTTTGHFFSAYDEVTENPESIYKKARLYEEKYGCYIVDILQTDRHLGRGFFAGGVGHPKSKLSEKANYVKSVHFCNKAFEFWEKLFKEKQVDLVIGLASAVLGKTCVTVARKRSIPMRELFRANFGAYHGWSDNEYYNLVGLKEVFETSSEEACRALVSPEELVSFKRLPFTETYYREFQKGVSWPVLLGKTLHQCKWYLYQWVKGRQTVGEYRLVEKLKLLLKMRRDLKRLLQYPLAKGEDLQGKAYVFFPLHVEPESSVGMMSPEMNEQLAAIEFIAKNLPAGVYLAVKEHLPAVGRRPRDFYQTILEIPNVVMFSPFTYALEIARGARAVAVITSTLGMEAALSGTPVISFGLHNNYNILPHVHTATSWTELRLLLKQLCDYTPTEEERATRQNDSRRYLAALKIVCIDLSWTNYGAKDRPPATEKEVQVIYESLVESLKH